MSEMVYDAHLEDLYKKYTALPEMEKRAVETLSVLFGGFYKYVKLRNLSALMGYKLTNPELTDLLTSLRKKGLVEVDGHYYVVEVELRLRLFLELIQDPHYVDLVFFFVVARSDECEGGQCFPEKDDGEGRSGVVAFAAFIAPDQERFAFGQEGGGVFAKVCDGRF